MRKMQLKTYKLARRIISKRCKPKKPDWVRPLKSFQTELWTHFGFALLMLVIFFGGWFSEKISASSLGLGTAAGCFMALLLMPGYKVCEKKQGEKLAVIKWWSVALRAIYLLSRALAIGLYRTPWLGVASLGGSVAFAIIVFQAVQGIYLYALLHRV